MRDGTIQGFIDSGDRLFAYCHTPPCYHHAELDMVKLRDQLGPDHGWMHDDLVPKLKCARCGSKKVGLIRQPGATQYRSGAKVTAGPTRPSED